MRKSSKKERKEQGYFDELKLVELLAKLNNSKSPVYTDLIYCLTGEYRDKMPEGFFLYGDMTCSEIDSILQDTNRVNCMMGLERFKRYYADTWFNRFLIWLARG